MKSAQILHLKILLLTACIFSLALEYVAASDYKVSGKVTDATGRVVPNAKVSMVAGTTEFASSTGSDGTYSIRVSGIYSNVPGLIEVGVAYPNPFSASVNIPFIINSSGDIRLTIFNLSGQKIKETFFYRVDAGSYRINWDGCNQNGSSQRAGFYMYAISFKGETRSGKIIKASGPTSSTTGTTLEPVMIPPVTAPPSGRIRISVITGVTCQNYYPVRLTDITIGSDTIINFELLQKQALPFKTSGYHIAMHTGTDYRPLVLKGINLGTSPPGCFPGEIAYSIPPEMYERWIGMMAKAGFNGLRIYTLHPPVFYEKLAEYNERNPDNPLLLFQGVWLEEVDDRWDPASYDLTNRIPSFTKEIHEVINCIHGNNDIAFRYGKAYGRYLTDVSRWTAGYIIGREISPQEVDSTDTFHPEMNSFAGYQFSIAGATATEVFATRMLDETVAFEAQNYSVRRPASISSWPTLDPLNHPTEIYTDEDRASFDITKISGTNVQAGVFACYHAYPYYPNFVSQQPSYQSYSDMQGQNSYLGYLSDLKNHYSGIPLVIGEFGVPSSWGSAHQSFSNMHHGGYSEEQQGEKNIRMMHNIIDAGCAGGFMFSWMDEWFKPTWIVSYLEAFGFLSGNAVTPTRQLWHNLTSPEQNFGLVTFDETGILPFEAYKTDNPSGPVGKIEATNDNSCFYINILAADNITPGDTMMIAFDTYLKNTGESLLPNGKHLSNRSEFLLSMIFGNDTALHHVTQAYDMNGLTLRFNLSDPSVQKYKTTVTDGAPWKEMQWYNDGYELTKSYIGRLPMENATDFTSGQRSVAAWSGNKIKVRIPWTMLYLYDPTQIKIIDGAVSGDGGYTFEILTNPTDGIALSVYYKGVVTSTTGKYSWLPWLIVPKTAEREKKSLQVVASGLSAFPFFAD
jgi:hypothetical protein